MRTRCLLLVLVGSGVLAGCGGNEEVETRHPEEIARAEQAWSMNRAADARSLLAEVVEDDADDFGAVYRLGVLELDNDPVRSAELLERAATLRPLHPGPRFFLARARFQLDETGGWEDDLEQAVILSRRRFGVALAETTEAVAAALEDYQRQRPRFAALPFRQAAETAMTDPGLWYLAGSTALEAANFPGARLSAERALEIDPQYPEGLVLLGRVLWAEGNRSGARAKFEEALALDPELPVAHTQLGMLLLEQTDFRPGLLELWTAVLLDPVDPLPHRELGHAFFSMRIPTEGVIYLERSDWLTTFLQTGGTEPAPGR